jgi:hypothetical protein
MFMCSSIYNVMLCTALQIKGSVIRKAKVVVSSGPEAAAVSEQESAEAIDTSNGDEDSAAAADTEE